MTLIVRLVLCSQIFKYSIDLLIVPSLPQFVVMHIFDRMLEAHFFKRSPF